MVAWRATWQNPIPVQIHLIPVQIHLMNSIHLMAGEMAVCAKQLVLKPYLVLLNDVR